MLLPGNVLALLRVVDEDFPAGSALLAPSGDEELAQRSREESCLSAEACRLRAHLLIVAGILLLDDLEDAWARGSRVVWRRRPGDDVNPALGRVIEDIVREQALVDWEQRDLLAARAIENREARGIAAGNDHPMMRFIERHGEIVRAAHRPVGDGLPSGKVGHLNFLLVRDIDEDAAPHLLELEGLGVRI